jgi:UDP-N-acetylmuramoyl-tripeptide--D-alanyl-D-alanine ligase
MIIRVLIAVVLAVPAYFYTMRYNIHMFQQNGYKNKEHLHWLKKKFRLQWILYFGLALGIVTCVFPYLALEIFEYLVLFVIIVVYRAMKRMNTKKKLVYTARVKRLLATELILTAAVFALVCGFGGMKRIPGLCLILVSVNLFLDIVANVINHPMEAGINQHYINDAVRKLKSVPGLTVIGVTGSYGKTSVKFYLQTLLQEKYNVLVTPESFNTPMGVVRTIRGSLKPTTEIFVCEMGARHVGDIKEICDMVHPEHGVITSIGPQHLETFFNMENIQKTKFELADALPEGGMLFLNGDNDYIQQQAASPAYDQTPEKIFYYSETEGTGYCAKDVKVSQLGTEFTVVTPDGESERFQMRLIGAHNVINVVGAIAVAHRMGMTLQELRIPVRRIEPVPHRMQMREHGLVTIIDDAYNSNPVVHGTNVEDGAFQGYLKTMGIPFVGCDVTASAIGMDKYIMKAVLKECDVPVLDAQLYTLADYAEMETLLDKVEKGLGYPVIVKPVNLGSSVGISVAKNRVELTHSVDDAFKYATKVLVEHAITNLREINCSVLGDENDAIASECEEPLHTKDILSYEDKYVSNAKGSGSKGMASVSRKIPAELSPEKREEVRELAVRSFKALGCNGVSRIDFMIDEDNGKLYFNEINTIPGSLAFYLWDPVGVPYKELLDRMIQLSLKRARTEERLTFTFDTNILNSASFGGSKGGKL